MCKVVGNTKLSLNISESMIKKSVRAFNTNKLSGDTKRVFRMVCWCEFEAGIAQGNDQAQRHDEC